MEWTLLLLYVPMGILVGFIAGLLGVGGGAILVPAFLFSAEAEGFPPEHAMHMALATSLACILASSFSSAKTHWQRGSVNTAVVKAMAPGIFLGSVGGSVLAARLSSGPLKIVFLLFLLYVAQDMLRKPVPQPGARLPLSVGLLLMGFLIGGFSSLVGIGGASLTVAFLVFCSVSMHEAIGTSAALGVVIALAGGLGYVYQGWHLPNLPAGSLGYVYLPAFFGVTLTSFFTAPWGARVAHRLPVRTLRRVFAVFLLIVSLRMAYGEFTPLFRLI
jgi:uncharacterized membrane protein YfcA